MSPLPTIADTRRTAWRWTASGKPDVVNVMHFSSSGGGVPTFFTIIEAAVDSDMWATTSSSYVVADITETDLSGSGASTVYTPATPANFTGGTGGDYSPASAAVVSLHTSLRGRSYRGRVYLGPLAEGAIGDGLITSGDLAAQRTAWSAFVTAMHDNDFDLLVASYKHSTSQPVDTVTIGSIVATQRRRQDAYR